MLAFSLQTTLTLDHALHLMVPTEFPEGPVKVTVESLSVNESNLFQPRTELGKRLLAYRQRAISKGMKLLNQDEILVEIRKRRGEDD